MQSNHSLLRVCLVPHQHMLTLSPVHQPSWGFSILAKYINSEEYNDKQKKQIATALGTSVAMLERHYIDNKPENIDVEFLGKKKKKKKKKHCI